MKSGSDYIADNNVHARSYYNRWLRHPAPCQFGLYKIFGQSLKFGQTQKLFVVSMYIYIRYYVKSVNESVSVIFSHQLLDFTAKMHQIQFRLGLDPPETVL